MIPLQAARLSSIAALLIAASVPALCGDWNPRLAAQYLDARQKEWAEWKQAAAPGGTCFSCHTNMTYLLARPALRRALGETAPTPYETGLLNGLRTRLATRDTTAGYPPFKKEPLATQALGVDTIFAALFLTQNEQALDRLWAVQLHDGKTKGAWPWFQVALDPWEMPESPFYGASLAALAVASAPAEYRARQDVREHVAELSGYLRNEQASQPMHNRLMLLWASTAMPDLLPKATRKSLIKELAGLQQPDGGWTIASLGPFKEHPDAPVSAGSNGYATGFAAFVMVKAGVKGPALTKALQWLRTHQDAATGTWEATSMNKHFEPGGMQDQFMRDAATSFASLALLLE